MTPNATPTPDPANDLPGTVRQTPDGRVWVAGHLDPEEVDPWRWHCPVDGSDTGEEYMRGSVVIGTMPGTPAAEAARLTVDGPWRVGRHIARHVYYGDDERAVTIQMEDGPLLVAALNAYERAADQVAEIQRLRAELERHQDAYIQVVAERDSARRERDAAMQARNAACRERDAALADLDQAQDRLAELKANTVTVPDDARDQLRAAIVGPNGIWPPATEHNAAERAARLIRSWGSPAPAEQNEVEAPAITGLLHFLGAIGPDQRAYVPAGVQGTSGPATPRSWGKAGRLRSPDGVTRVRDYLGRIWVRTRDTWDLETGDNDRSYYWHELLGNWGRLTEVPADTPGGEGRG